MRNQESLDSVTSCRGTATAAAGTSGWIRSCWCVDGSWSNSGASGACPGSGVGTCADGPTSDCASGAPSGSGGAIDPGSFH